MLKSVSDDEINDKQNEKTIVNIDVGLLEMSSNNAKTIFDSLKGACSFRSPFVFKTYAFHKEGEALVEDEHGLTTISAISC